MYLVLLIGLIFVNAFFAMSEIAILSINTTKIKKMAEHKNKNAQILIKLSSIPAKFLATIQVGVTLSGFLASAVAADQFVSSIADQITFMPLSRQTLEGIILFTVTLILSYFTLVFGELTPKRIGMKNPDQIALAVAPIIWVVYLVAKPFVAILAASTNGLLALFGIGKEDDPEEVTEEEILMLIDEGEIQGNIEEEEREMINNIFLLDDKKASDIMTHRLDMIALSEETSIEKAIEVITEKGYSRIPVYRNNQDHIVGILYSKDLLRLVGKEAEGYKMIRDYLHKPLYVPESKNCNELLKQMQVQKIHMVIVVDEYGGTSGIVTLEDLIEVIVGNIEDEFDHEEKEIVELEEGIYLVEGSIALDELEKIIGFRIIEDENSDTLAGVIMTQLGRVPKENEEISGKLQNCEFKVVSISDRRIEKVKLAVLRS